MFEKQREAKANTAAAGRQDSNPAAGALAAQGAQKSSGRTAVIGSGIKIKGDITGDENVVIEGSVNGSIQLGKNQVSIGQSGDVKANITARVVSVDGRVNGDIIGQEKVIISRTGNVRGNIKAPRVTLEDGAIFKGSIDMDPGEVVGKESKEPASAQEKTNGKSMPAATALKAESPGKEAGQASKTG